jgi:hypothetical protein
MYAVPVLVAVQEHCDPIPQAPAASSFQHEQAPVTTR